MLSPRDVVRCSSRLVATSVNQLLVVPFWLLLFLAIQPTRLAGHATYLRLEGTLYKSLLDLVAYWGWVEGFRLYESGDDISEYTGRRCLVMANHQSTADIPTLFAALHDKPGATQRVMWVSDLELMFSHVGLVMLGHGDLFLRQKLGPDEREKTLKKMDSHLVNKFIRKDRKWCVLFPEGGFLRKRRATSQRFAEKNGYPILSRVSIPRVHGIERILNTVNSHGDSPPLLSVHEGGRVCPPPAAKDAPFEYVIDVTIAYADQGSCLGLPDMMAGWRRPEDIHVHYSVIPLSQVPYYSKDELMHFMIRVWSEKERLLDCFYSTGSFKPAEGSTGRSAPQCRLCAFDDRKYLAMNLVYSCLTIATTTLATYLWRKR